MPEQLRLQQVLRHGAAVDGDERLVAARAATMDGARQQLLAGAALAGDQHARIRSRDHVRLRELLLHAGAAGDDLRAPVLIRGAEAGDPQRLLHLVEELLFVDRLGENAERAHLRRLHRSRNGAVRGEDDDLQTRPAVLQLLEQPDAVHLVHAQVRDDQIGPEAARCRQGLRGALHRFDLVTLRAQADGQQAQQSRVIVDQEDTGFAFAGLVQDRVLAHCDHRPVLPGLRSFRERSMLAMASSLARASSSSLRRRTFSSISACRRWLALATRCWSARTASLCSLRFSASSVKWSSICESSRNVSARSPGNSISGFAISSRSSPWARRRSVAGWPGVPRISASFSSRLRRGAVSYSRCALATISACSEGRPCTSLCSSCRYSLNAVELAAAEFTTGAGAGARSPGPTAQPEATSATRTPPAAPRGARGAPASAAVRQAGRVRSGRM